MHIINELVDYVVIGGGRVKKNIHIDERRDIYLSKRENPLSIDINK
jgi:hypothetical protein